tara:strand:+ start:693 stop:1142 length:450 start_codon:yes stop_codon:yes gene_type:complete
MSQKFKFGDVPHTMTTMTTMITISKPNEFGGLFGTVATTIALPLLTYFLATIVSQPTIPPFPSLSLSSYYFPGGLQTLLPQCIVICTGWFLFLLILERIIPCNIAQGTTIMSTSTGIKGKAKGFRLSYNINANKSFLLTIFIIISLESR